MFEDILGEHREKKISDTTVCPWQDFNGPGRQSNCSQYVPNVVGITKNMKSYICAYYAEKICRYRWKMTDLSKEVAKKVAEDII